MKAIIAAIDFSRGTRLVVSTAAALARALEGKVVLLTVLVEPVFLEEYAPSPKKIARVTVAHASTVRRRLARLREQLQSELVPAEVVLRQGGAARHIVDEAEKHDAAFIVIGSHGHTALFDLVLGSTTQAVVRRARQPVVVVPVKMCRRLKPRRRVRSMPSANRK